MIGHFIRTGLSKIGREHHVRSASQFMKRGATGTLAVAGYGAGGASGYYSYGNNYGAGAGVLIGVGEAAAYELAFATGPTGMIIGVAAIGSYFAYQRGREIYTKNRRMNMGRPMIDNYGTINQMRIQSIQNLSRSRAGASRVLGNEARMLHR